MVNEFIIGVVSFLAGFGARDLVYYLRKGKEEAKKHGGVRSEPLE